MEEIVFHGNYIWLIQVDPFYKSLRQYEEFKQIIKRQEKKFANIRAEVD